MQLFPGQYIFVIQVYLLCVNHPNEKYYDSINNLYDVFNTYSDQGDTIFLGDFNADIQSQIHTYRQRLLYKFVNDCTLCAMNMHKSCIGPNNSYVSYDDKFTSLIDYVFVPCEISDCVCHCEVADDACLNVSMHRPILCCFDFIIHTDEPVASKKYINWKSAHNDHVMKYCESLDEALQIDTVQNLTADQLYYRLCEVMNTCANDCFPTRRFRGHLKPFWTDALTALHSQMAESRDAWQRAGRPRGTQHSAYRQNKEDKANFRRVMRQCADRYMAELDN